MSTSTCCPTTSVRARASGSRCLPPRSRSPSASCSRCSRSISGRRPGTTAGSPTPCGARACGSRIPRCRSAWASCRCNTSPTSTISSRGASRPLESRRSVKREPHHPGSHGAARHARGAPFGHSGRVRPGRDRRRLHHDLPGIRRAARSRRNLLRGPERLHARVDPDVRDDGRGDRLLAGVIPGIMLTGLFMLWTLFIIWKRGFRSHAVDFRYSWKEKFESIPKIAPFLAIIVGVMYVLYGGVATPSEAAGVGAALCVVLAVLIYRMWQPRDWWQILRDTTRESVMILTIIGAAVLFGYMLTSLYLTQTLAQAIADMHVNRWVLMALINLFLLVCGFFIPPAAIILMTSPILLPIIRAAGFDPVWFGVVMTINMEIGLIHPPVGLNIYIVKAIAPDVPLMKVIWGTIPYVLCMFLAIIILCIFPEIATWLPNHMMGAKH